MILLNPGPVTLTERVKKALSRPDLCHREPEFSDLQNSIRHKLLNVYELSDSDWAPILITGSGTAAIEAMLVSCVPKNGKVLVLENGVYGERMSQILDAYGINHEKLQTDWETTINITAVKRLVSQTKYSHIAVVHHETTTGRLNNLHEIVELCSEFGNELILDCVSSFGAEKIPFDPEIVTACAATANKCLHGVPGTSFVMLNRNLTKGRVPPSRSVYLDLFKYLRAQDASATPFTQSIQTFYALDEALSEFFEEGGLEARHLLYRRRMDAISDALLTMDITGLLPDDSNSVVLKSFVIPSGKTYSQIHDHLKSKGFIIYAGQGHFSDKIFRISLMGNITAIDLENLVEALRYFSN